MKQNRNPVGFLIGALLLGVFWGLLTQWGSKTESHNEELELAVAFGIRSVPMMLYIPKEGKPNLEVGAPNKDQLKYLVDGLLEKSKGKK